MCLSLLLVVPVSGLQLISGENFEDFIDQMNVGLNINNRALTFSSTSRGAEKGYQSPLMEFGMCQGATINMEVGDFNLDMGNLDSSLMLEACT